MSGPAATSTSDEGDPLLGGQLHSYSAFASPGAGYVNDGLLYYNDSSGLSGIQLQEAVEKENEEEAIESAVEDHGGEQGGEQEGVRKGSWTHGVPFASARLL